MQIGALEGADRGQVLDAPGLGVNGDAECAFAIAEGCHSQF
jgi:hypothetical protein